MTQNPAYQFHWQIYEYAIALFVNINTSGFVQVAQRGQVIFADEDFGISERRKFVRRFYFHSDFLRTIIVMLWITRQLRITCLSHVVLYNIITSNIASTHVVFV